MIQLSAVVVRIVPARCRTMNRSPLAPSSPPWPSPLTSFHIASSTIDAFADGLVRQHLHIVPLPVGIRPLVQGGPLLLGQCLVSTAQQGQDIPRGGPGVLRKDLASGATPGEEMPRAQRLLRARRRREWSGMSSNECAAAVRRNK